METLDTLITAGIAANRAEALRWVLARIRERPAYAKFGERARDLDELKAPVLTAIGGKRCGPELHPVAHGRSDVNRFTPVRGTCLTRQVPRTSCAETASAISIAGQDCTETDTPASRCVLPIVAVAWTTWLTSGE